MASKREHKQDAKDASPGGRPALKRRRPAPAGRVARRHEPELPRFIALDEHSVQVREEIDAALSEALRLREDIAQRIEQALP